jgi:hypothetical protein
MDTNQQSELKAAFELAEKHFEPKVVDLAVGDQKLQVLVAAKGTEVTSIKELADEYRTAPERRKGLAEMTELESFIAHVKRFSDEDSALFADRDARAPSLTCVLDYHKATAEGAPRFGQHRTRYVFPLAEEWVAWTGASGKPMTQALFAEWLENRIADVSDPLEALDTTKNVMNQLLCTFASPAVLVDLARGLTVRVESVVANSQTLKSGESVMRFDTQHTDERGAPLNIPGAFLIAVPVFRSGARYQLAAKLRYRVAQGKVSWFFDLHRAAETLDHAIREAADAAAAATELPLYVGRPEGS